MDQEFHTVFRACSTPFKECRVDFIEKNFSYFIELNYPFCSLKFWKFLSGKNTLGCWNLASGYLFDFSLDKK